MTKGYTFKAKDFTSEAKAKDMTSCPRGASSSRLYKHTPLFAKQNENNRKRTILYA